MIDLYTASTPNGWKVSILLEELGVDYKVHPINLTANEQKTPDYLKKNPNGRIPAIVDNDNLDENGNGFAVFESGAIMLYLAEKYGKFMPADVNGKSLVIQWLMFQMSGVGPMMGQANVFFRYFPEKIPAAIDRYQSESRRLFEVLESRLSEHEFLAGDYSIADMATYSWVLTYSWSGVSVEGLPNLKRWLELIRARPAVEKGLAVPADIAKQMDSKEAEEAFVKGAQSMVQGIKKES